MESNNSIEITIIEKMTLTEKEIELLQLANQVACFYEGQENMVEIKGVEVPLDGFKSLIEKELVLEQRGFEGGESYFYEVSDKGMLVVENLEKIKQEGTPIMIEHTNQGALSIGGS